MLVYKNNMNKGKKSLYTAISSLVLILFNGLIGLFVTRLVISTYGSDFNGINSTANQFINMLLIVEGGFTLATSVALFKPLTENNYNSINQIMAATKNSFVKIGTAFLLIGIISSFGYSALVKSGLPREIATLTFLMTVVSTFFNLVYATKYRILLQTEQKEYVLNYLSMGTVLLAQSMIIVTVYSGGHMLLVRFVTMIAYIINSLLIGYVCKKNYNYLNFKVMPDYASIKGTKDVMIQNMTGLIYSSVPIIFISITAGTLYASVYAVYNSIFILIKNALHSFINAPKMGFGKLIAEKEKEYVQKVFMQYELIVVSIMICLLTTTAVLIMPFISIYTRGISDIGYSDWTVSIILIGITFFEIVHIPSGNIINMSGNFKISKKIQLIAMVVLIITMVIGSLVLGFYGILLAVLTTAILLAVLEISYVHTVYFNDTLFEFARLLLPNTILGILLIFVEIELLPTIDEYFRFFILGFVLVMINGCMILILNLITNRKKSIEVFNRLQGLIPRK